MLRLILVRHGQTDANLNRFLQGPGDGLLNVTGLQQAEALGGHLKDLAIDRIISSPLHRAQQTAAAIARHHSLAVETSIQVKEWDCGSLDGMPADVFIQKLQESNQPLSLFRPEGGETLLEVRQRAAKFVEELTVRCQDETVVVCTHGDFMRAILSVLKQIDFEQAADIFFENASYSILEMTDGHWDVIALNQLPEKRDLLASVNTK